MKVKLTVFFFRPTNVLYLSIHSNNFSTYTRLEEKIIRMLVASFFAYFIQASVGLTAADQRWTIQFSICWFQISYQTVVNGL